MRIGINFKIISVCIAIVIVVIGAFSLCARATTGQYASVTGSYYTDSDSREWATASATNISSTLRYITVSVKNEKGVTLGSGGGKTSSGAMTSVNSVNITTSLHAYAHCTVYNSTSPSSGSVESLMSVIK